ncbi:hypothetical protein [Niameybacter massiliensis]|uniref:hypothetical protein n=1 Tax=Niameybacter massiliensis TaxID=1658108 RepID=UPI0006B53E66|nr:hypothetical protein [Niameybacter massiliensis]
MLQLTLMEFFFRVIPDAILFMIGAHIFSNKPMQKNNMLKSILCMAITVYLIRCLPITFGIHTLLGVVATTLIIIGFHKIDLLQAIRATFLTTLIQYISELLNMVWIQLCLGKELEAIFANPTTKLLYGLPSLAFSALILYICYILKRHRKEAVRNGD